MDCGHFFSERWTISDSIELNFLKSHLVRQVEVTLTPLQQQPCNVRVPPLRREHQGCGPLAVLDVSVRSTAQ